jgi:hypothetical protein
LLATRTRSNSASVTTGMPRAVSMADSVHSRSTLSTPRHERRGAWAVCYLLRLDKNSAQASPTRHNNCQRPRRRLALKAICACYAKNLPISEQLNSCKAIDSQNDRSSTATSEEDSADTTSGDSEARKNIKWFQYCTFLTLFKMCKNTINFRYFAYNSPRELLKNYGFWLLSVGNQRTPHGDLYEN